MGAGARKKASPPSMWESRADPAVRGRPGSAEAKCGREQRWPGLSDLFLQLPLASIFLATAGCEPNRHVREQDDAAGKGDPGRASCAFLPFGIKVLDVHARLVCCLQTDDDIDFAGCRLGSGKRNRVNVTGVVDIGPRCWVAGPHSKSGCRDGAGDSDDIHGLGFRFLFINSGPDRPSSATQPCRDCLRPPKYCNVDSAAKCCSSASNAWMDGGKTRVGESLPRAASVCPRLVSRTLPPSPAPDELPLRCSGDCLGTWRSPCLRPMRSAAQPRR